MLPERLLVVAAHPDDEVLGAGGLIHRVVREGGAVCILIMSEGASTQYPDRPDLVDRKQAEAKLAAAALGARAVIHLDLPDMKMGLEPPSRIAQPILENVLDWAPDWVVTHFADDLNADHRATHEATRVACRHAEGRRLRLLSYEVPSSTEYGYQAFQPDVFVRLEEEDLAAKLRALSTYASETRPWPHGRSSEALTALSRTRGYQSASPSAEAFATVWEVL